MSHDKSLEINEESRITKSELLLFAQTKPANLPIKAQRLFLAVLANINPNDKEQYSFIINGKDIAALANLPANVVGQQLQEIHESADKLRQYTLSIQEDDGNELRVGLISSTKYFKGSRAIKVNIDPALMPYLREMKTKFAISYSAGGPMKFKSEYSICLYDMMMYYLAEGKHYFTLEETRKMFNIEDGKVLRTATLNQRVINKAISDINEYTNITVDVEQHKAPDRKIVGYTFYVKAKENTPNVINHEEEENKQFFQKLISHPYFFNKVSLIKLIDEYGIKSVKNNFEYTLKKKPQNFAGYLRSAVVGQWAEKEMEKRQIKAVNPFKDIEPTEHVTVEQVSLIPDELERSNDETPKEEYDKLKEKMLSSNPALYKLMMDCEEKRKKL